MAALGVHQQLLVTGLTVQFVLVGAFHAELADQRRAGIVGHVDPLLVLLADGGHVAERVYAGAALRVVPGQARPDLDAGEVLPPNGEPREFLLAQLQPHRHRVERAAGLDGSQHAVALLGGHEIELDQP